MRIRAIAIGQASSHAQSVIKSDRKMTWELVKEVEKPRILWARIAQVHEDTEVGQVAVRFDTEQVGHFFTPFQIFLFLVERGADKL